MFTMITNNAFWFCCFSTCLQGQKGGHDLSTFLAPLVAVWLSSDACSFTTMSISCRLPLRFEPKMVASNWALTLLNFDAKQPFNASSTLHNSLSRSFAWPMEDLAYHWPGRAWQG